MPGYVEDQVSALAIDFARCMVYLGYNSPAFGTVDDIIGHRPFLQGNTIDSDYLQKLGYQPGE
jgi:hypothetical protein